MGKLSSFSVFCLVTGAVVTSSVFAQNSQQNQDVGTSLQLDGQKRYELGSNKLDRVLLTHTMNFPSCHSYSASVTPYVCILLGRRNSADNICKQNKFISCIISWKGQFDYWEPSELIEVSCRKGFSLLMPNGVGQDVKGQACAGGLNGSGGSQNKRWFFDARVWAINGGAGAAREQAAGSTLRQQSVVCGGNDPLIRLQGYAKKFDSFSRGGGSGPGQSWEAYISDYDASWSKDDANAQLKAPPQAQACTGASIENCWGSVQPMSGWVVHPHQPVAAALAMWRAHNKAQGRVSQAPTGTKINMDYPFIKRNSSFGQSMGLPGGAAASGGGRMGSDCFQPGDPGPWWYNINQKQTKPEEIPALMNQLRAGDATNAADINPGVYIFTLWVQSGCTLHKGMAGTNVQNAINGCRDVQKY